MSGPRWPDSNHSVSGKPGGGSEYGVTGPQGPAHVGRLARAVEDPDSGLPEPVWELGVLLLAQIAELDVKIAGLESDLMPVRTRTRRPPD